MFCLNCNTKTENPKFCTRSCAASYNNRIYPKRKQNRKCNRENCNELVKSYRHRLCEKHHYEKKHSVFFTMTLGEHINYLLKQGYHYSWATGKIRNLARSWNKHLKDKPCHNCGYDKHVEICHIKPVSSFNETSLLSEINSPENVVQLCRNCHWEFDKGLITL